MHTWVWNTSTPPWADHNARTTINVWSTTASLCRQVQSIYGFGTHQHHPGPTTCVNPTINVWSTTAYSCIPGRKHKRVWNITSSPWADHNARPTMNMWSTADSSCRQARTHKRNDVNHIITPGSHVARLVAYISVNHVAITLGKDNNLNMVRNIACARRNNVATENIFILEDNLQTQKDACRCSACKNAKPCTNYCINLVVRDVGLTAQPVGKNR
ncbi:hypothetical protein NP493_37g07027 [Ridgeia piscesae]|uniref:Uncharacterized protein n=1 Tax=Ridgeia piscesae TaxID=27915 RepID=A0AAD9PCB4_RIDPI|nr:hypothetical protein NP493_37g07027 [Ridgeia piscesae]